MSLRKCESVTHYCVRLRARLRSAGSGQSRRGCWGATGVMCSQALGRVSPVRNHRKAHLQSMLGVPVAIGLLGDHRRLWGHWAVCGSDKDPRVLAGKHCICQTRWMKAPEQHPMALHVCRDASSRLVGENALPRSVQGRPGSGEAGHRAMMRRGTGVLDCALQLPEDGAHGLSPPARPRWAGPS